MSKKVKEISTILRPPIVAILGHVDHGKTTLLDVIRKSNVAAHEHGGITQHIGAYQVMDITGRIITFIDTPGHEAFSKIRSRGANIADIAILVVAADDGVMPQTKESIIQIKNAGIPFIVACNKIDLSTANPDKVRQDLAKNGVQVEGFGGDVPMVMISAKQNQGIKDLLDRVTLVCSLKGLSNEVSAPLEAVVVETRIDKGRGLTATAIIKKGTLKPGMKIFEKDQELAKVRAMFDENGKKVDAATPSKPVEILGFTKLPTVGAILKDVKSVMDTPIIKNDITEVNSLPDFLKPIGDEVKELNVVLKADTAGSIEAIIQALPEQIHVINAGMGPISETDVMMAKATKAFVIGFNVKFNPDIEKFAFAEKVVVRSYNIIYELLDELNEVVSGMEEVLTSERELGQGVIIAEFPFNDLKVAGTKITVGRIARGDTVRIMRGETQIADLKVKSMRHGKNEVNKAETGIECGIIFDRKVDFSLSDVIIAYAKI